MRFLTSGYQLDVEAVVGGGIFPSEGEGLVLVRDVEFYSLLPGGRIIGLSKIPRIVELFARRFQVQERITAQVAHALEEVLEPQGVIVIAEAQHMCMAMRGVQKQQSATITRALRGIYAHDPLARQEAISLLKT